MRAMRLSSFPVPLLVSLVAAAALVAGSTAVGCSSSSNKGDVSDGGGGDDDKAAVRAEQKLLLQETLNAMDPLDREVLTLRHCEQLSNDETATVLGIPKSQASEAYIRALKRIPLILAALPGFKAES